MTLRRRTVRANGLDFPVIEAGEGPLALCLHGFPDHARSWIGLIEHLAEEGYHAVAPAMRGYWSEGAAPDGAYQPWATGRDALALIEALGYSRAHLVGHDWGASAAYAAANLGADKIDKLVALAVPYGPQVSAAFLMDGDQQKRSWYMFFFQLDLASLAVPMNDFALIDRLWAEWSPGYSLPEAERFALKEMFAQPGVLDQTLAYYRQLFSTSPPAGVGLGGPIAAPTLYMHGLNDGCMGASLANGMANRFTGGFRMELIDGAGHFLHLEQPRRVADLITEFLGAEVPVGSVIDAPV
jgi:pimeloyl-ACP methyl ester carboxylesterase